MEAFETTTTVVNRGEIHLSGLPFVPGTEVRVVVNPQAETPADEAQLAASRDRMAELFRTVKGFRLGEKIPREELHERGSLR